MANHPGLLDFLGALKDDIGGIDFGFDVLNEAVANFAGLAVKADGSGFAAFSDDLPGAGCEFFFDGADPFGGGDDNIFVLAADFGEDLELAVEALDIADFIGGGHRENAIRDFNEAEVVVAQEVEILLQTAAIDGEFEKAAAAADVDVVGPVEFDFFLKTFGHDGGGPAEFDDIDMGGGYLQDGAGFVQAHALVHHMGQSDLPWA